MRLTHTAAGKFTPQILTPCRHNVYKKRQPGGKPPG
jgi:hypothetical protein